MHRRFVKNVLYSWSACLIFQKEYIMSRFVISLLVVLFSFSIVSAATTEGKVRMLEAKDSQSGKIHVQIKDKDTGNNVNINLIQNDEVNGRRYDVYLSLLTTALVNNLRVKVLYTGTTSSSYIQQVTIWNPDWENL